MLVKGGCTMIKSAVIIPTGDEIASGVVLDTDSPEVMRQLLALEPTMSVSRCAPVRDEEDAIVRAVAEVAQTVDLVVLIGGSGGGHRFDPALGRDFTHTALEQVLEDVVSRRLFGKNGHLWCRLVCGRLGSTLVINLPGPFVEAKSAMEAFCQSIEDDDPETINQAMIAAVMETYPVKVDVR